MSASFYLVAMMALPAIGAAVVAALPRDRSLLAKQVTLGVSLAVLLLAVLATVAFVMHRERLRIRPHLQPRPNLEVRAHRSASAPLRRSERSDPLPSSLPVTPSALRDVT